LFELSLGAGRRKRHDRARKKQREENTVMTQDTTQILGAAATLYGLGGALSVLLQARQMYVRGTSCDVSARFLTVYVGGFAVWLLYGLGIGSIPIIVVHAVGLLCGTITLAVLLWLRRPGVTTTRLVGEEVHPGQTERQARRVERWPFSEGPVAFNEEVVRRWSTDAQPCS
jgi:uncharacterized protein with PQ loop repeat